MGLSIYLSIWYGVVNKIAIYEWDEWEGHAVKLVPPPTIQSRFDFYYACIIQQYQFNFIF